MACSLTNPQFASLLTGQLSGTRHLKSEAHCLLCRLGPARHGRGLGTGCRCPAAAEPGWHAVLTLHKVALYSASACVLG